ncbi:MAG: M81 family metallopeptidase [Phocaeicola sp.]
MKSFIRSLYQLGAITTLLPFIYSCNSAEEKLPRIAIAGISIECSTFSPAQTTEDMFRKRSGEALFDAYSFLHQDSLLRGKAEWLPAMVAWATPGGIVTAEAYNSLKEQIISQLKDKMPCDALFLELHGAMSVVGLDDPESDFIRAIREVVGYDAIISTSTDPHGSVSHALAKETDLITSYRKSPHEDSMQSKRRTVKNLIDRLEEGTGKPKYKAWVKVPILLPGEKTSTRVEPGKSIYAGIEEFEGKEGVVDASIWISYAWADEPRNHAVVVAYGDSKESVGHAALELASRFWDARDRFEFVAPTADLEVCLEAAFKSKTKPYFISDMGDNPTAGGAGDVTWTLTELLKRKEFKQKDGPSLVYAAIPGPELVEKAVKLGVGKTVEAPVGAMVDNRYAAPLLLKGEILAIAEGENTQVVVQVGSIKVVVSERRQPFHYERNFTNVGINPREEDIIMPKLGYLTPELFDMQQGWMMALTRGGVDQDLEKLPYNRVERPLFPLDKDFEAELEVVYIPLSGE